MNFKTLLIPALGFGLLAQGQVVFNAVSGGNRALFEENGGVVSNINTGLASNDFPSLSRDGRLIVISAVDPEQPFQPSTDLFLWNRDTQERRRIVNHTTVTLEGGETVTINPRFSALSPDNAVVVVNDLVLISSPQGSGVTPQLNLYQVSDGFWHGLIEQGLGDQLDLTRSEFLGISWKPDGSGFATPAYMTVPTQMGGLRDLVGIVLYQYNPVSRTATRQAALSTPRFYDAFSPIPSETHVLPVFSPDGTRLAYFEIYWPTPILTQQVTTTLLVANANGTNVQRLNTLPQGSYPMRLTWTADGSQLVYAFGSQPFDGFSYGAFGDPNTAVIRRVSSTALVAPTQVPGINQGFFPLLPARAGHNLASTPLRITRLGNGDLLLQALGLPSSTLFGLEFSEQVGAFPHRQDFTGADFGSGITLNTQPSQRFFRIVE